MTTLCLQSGRWPSEACCLLRLLIIFGPYLITGNGMCDFCTPVSGFGPLLLLLLSNPRQTHLHLHLPSLKVLARSPAGGQFTTLLYFAPPDSSILLHRCSPSTIFSPLILRKHCYAYLDTFYSFRSFQT